MSKEYKPRPKDDDVSQSATTNPFDDNNNLIVDDPEEPKPAADPLKGDADDDVLTAGNQSRQFGA